MYMKVQFKTYASVEDAVQCASRSVSTAQAVPTMNWIDLNFSCADSVEKTQSDIISLDTAARDIFESAPMGSMMLVVTQGDITQLQILLARKKRLASLILSGC